MFLNKTLYLLLSTGSTQEDLSQYDMKNYCLGYKESKQLKNNSFLVNALIYDQDWDNHFFCNFPRKALSLCENFVFPQYISSTIFLFSHL